MWRKQVSGNQKSQVHVLRIDFYFGLEGKNDAHQLCKVTFQFAHRQVWFIHTHFKPSTHLTPPCEHKKHRKDC